MVIVWLYPLGASEMNDIVERLKAQRMEPVENPKNEFVEPV